MYTVVAITNVNFYCKYEMILLFLKEKVCLTLSFCDRDRESIVKGFKGIICIFMQRRKCPTKQKCLVKVAK